MQPLAQEILTLLSNSFCLFCFPPPSAWSLGCSALSTLKLPFNTGPLQPLEILNTDMQVTVVQREVHFLLLVLYARVDATQFPKYGHLPWQQLQHSFAELAP